MKRKTAGRVRQVIAFAASCSLLACNGQVTTPVPKGVAAEAPHFALDVSAVVTGLASKANRTWQDGITDGIPGVRKALQALRGKNYRTQAAAVTWNLPLASACSNAPAYLKPITNNTAGPASVTGDYIYLVLDNGTVEKIDAVTKAVTTVSLGTTFTKTSVAISGDNKRLYLLSATGTFYVLNAGTLATTYSAKISNAGFVGQSPFIDYTSNTSGGTTIFGSNEHVFAMATDGSLYHLNVVDAPGAPTVTINAFTSSNGTDQGAGLAAWNTKVNIPYGVAVTLGATPIFARGHAYVGTTTGVFYDIPINLASLASAPVIRSWNLFQYTSASGNGAGCNAPCALDYDNALNATAVFAPVGDRVCWIDVASGNVYPSPSLVADKVTGTVAQSVANFPFTTTSTAYAPFDWECVAANNTYTPTRWGYGGATSIFGTPVNCTTIKKDPIGGNMWAGQYVATPNGNVQGLTPAGSVVFTTQSGAPNVNEIAFDPAGNCYAAHGASPIISKFNNAGTLLGTTINYPGGKNAGWPQPDALGNLWCTSWNAGNVTQFNSTTGAVNFTQTLAGAFAIAVDASNNAFVSTSAASATVTKYNSAGAVAVGWPVTVGNFASYVAIEPTTGNIWTTNYNSNTVSKLSPTGVTLGTYATPSGPWAIAFDTNGLPWVSCIGATNVSKMSLTGSILASYAIPNGGRPFELAFDGSGACWVSCSNGTYKIFDLGNLSDLFATDSFGAVGDGIDSRANLDFKIPKGSYGNKPPVAATLAITAATTPTVSPVETLNLYYTSPFLSGTSTLWLGYQTPANVNMNYDNRATLITSTPLATLSGITPVKDTTQTFTLNGRFPTDSINSSDAANAWHNYAFNAAGLTLVNAAHWYSNTTAPAGSAPKMTVSFATTLLPTTSGIQCQPVVDTVNKTVYVESANTMFELPYDPASATSPAAFANTTKVFYTMSHAARGGGPVSGGTYIYPRGNVQQNFYGDLFVVDQEVSTGKIYANRFTTPFAATPTTDHLAAWFDASPGTGTIGQSMLWDYDKGSVYFTTSNNQLIRGKLY